MSTSNTTVAPEILPYIKQLSRRLAGLPDDERIELLSDLERHLEEIVSDESGVPLSERIGPPDAYADEFAASAGIDEVKAPSRTLLGILAGRLRRLSSHHMPERAGRLWIEMRPAWWTIRGLAIGVLLMWYIFAVGNFRETIGLYLLAAVIVLALVGVSMRIGRNQERGTGRHMGKWLSVGVTVVVVLAFVTITFGFSLPTPHPMIHDFDGLMHPMVTTTSLPPGAPLIITP